VAALAGKQDTAMKITPPTELYLMGLDGEKFIRSDKVSWRGPCPRCVGHHRLLVFVDHPFPKWHVICDMCGYKAWADQMNPNLKQPISNEAKRAYAEKAASEQRLKDAERGRKLKAFSDSEIGAEYHERMTASQRQTWRDAGIPDDWQDYFTLGYTHRTFAHDGKPFSSDAMTIPIYDFGRKSVNMQYRIMSPPEGVGKYRQEAGLPSAAFLSDPDRSTFTDEVIVVEGAKKAMVLSVYGTAAMMTIGLPGARSWAGMVERLQAVGRVYVMLDPDARQPAADLCRAIGKNARLVRVPEKPDDLLMKFGATFDDIRRAFKYGALEWKV